MQRELTYAELLEHGDAYEAFLKRERQQRLGEGVVAYTSRLEVWLPAVEKAHANLALGLEAWRTEQPECAANEHQTKVIKKVQALLEQLQKDKA